MKKNKGFYLSAVAVATLAMLAACGNESDTNTNADTSTDSSSDGDKPDVLEVWADGNDIPDLEPLAEEFTEETGIEVSFTAVSMNDQPDVLTLDGPAGRGPDLFYQPGVGDLPLKGLVQPMEVDEDILAQYTGESVDALSHDGNIYGLPFVVETYALFYNKDIIEEPPTTLAELTTIMEEHTDVANDEYGFLFEALNFYFAYAFMGGNGGYIFGEDGDEYDIFDIGLANEGSIEAGELFQEWYDNGYLPTSVNGDIVGGLFEDGKVAAIINGPWAVQSHREQLDNVAVAPLPLLDNGEALQSFIGVKGWMLSAFTEEQEWATELAIHLTNAESALQWFEVTGEMPAVEEVLTDPVVTEDEMVRGFSEQIPFGIPFPSAPELSHVWDPMADALNFIANGENVEEVLQEAVETIEDEMRRAGAQ